MLAAKEAKRQTNKEQISKHENKKKESELQENLQLQKKESQQVRIKNSGK